MNDSPEGLIAVLIIMAALFFMAGFAVGKTEEYRIGCLSAYEHIRKEIQECLKEVINEQTKNLH
jgi:hypothetical protein